ncbi:MAG: hypothetical protein QOI32_666 [Thermoleophilaceae bacterium]|nr:hypothetical protein [Thermoleophilaceae bacterium]
MIDRLRRSALPAALVLLCLAAAAPAALAVPITVNLRVEGPSKTVFDGPVTTDGHAVTTATGGTHTCDGTNDNAQPEPGPVPTAALDDAAKLAGFTIDGPYGNFGIEDFFLERVADEQIDPSSAYWALFVNFQFSDKGGCQKRILAGQDVLWAGIPFSVSTPLKLEGPNAVTTGQPLQVRVTDGSNGNPQSGATVGGTATGPDGRATLVFPEEGIYRLKAEKPDTIRSNSIVLCVDPPGAAECTSGDKTAPVVESGFGADDPALPGRELASRTGRSRTILVSWGAQDGAGSGVEHYSVEVARINRGASASQADPEWRSLLDKTSTNGLHFRGDSGAAYRFRITATDRALNSSAIVTNPVLIPVDDRDRRLLRLSRAWKRSRAAGAWGRTVVRATKAEATGRMRFRGRQVALIGRELRRGGRLRVTVDGRSRVVRTRGRSGHRDVLWVSRRLRAGSHTLRLRSLGGGPVELDAVAVSP